MTEPGDAPGAGAPTAVGAEAYTSPAERPRGPEADATRAEGLLGADADPTRADERRAAGRLTAPMGLVAAAVLAVDQVTKWVAQRELADGHSVRVVGSLLRFTLTYNSGMAFSRGTGLGPVIGVVALVVIVVLLASLRRESSRLARVALAAVIGGALGNIVDRLFRAGDGFMGGSVVDFLQLPHWPVFNVADMAVTLGGLTLVLGAWRSGRSRGASGGSRSAPSQ
jgi:signal peptidase II